MNNTLFELFLIFVIALKKNILTGFYHLNLNCERRIEGSIKNFNRSDRLVIA